MDISSSNATGNAAAGVMKDAFGAQLITKTLDKMNTAQSLSGPQVNADYQFQKEVLNSAGIGNKLDVTA